MRYDVRVTKADGSEGQFDHEQADEIKVDDAVRAGGMTYRVRTVTPTPADDPNYDAVVEADWAWGPVQASFQGD